MTVVNFWNLTISSLSRTEVELSVSPTNRKFLDGFHVSSSCTHFIQVFKCNSTMHNAVNNHNISQINTLLRQILSLLSTDINQTKRTRSDWLGTRRTCLVSLVYSLSMNDVMTTYTRWILMKQLRMLIIRGCRPVRSVNYLLLTFLLLCCRYFL